MIVVPNKHIENIYDMEPEYGHHIMDIVQKMAIAMKKGYQCDGIMLRQNNEPASGQHAFHFHLHIFPRYDNDNYTQNADSKRVASPEERQKYINKIKDNL